MDIADWQKTREHCVTLRYRGETIEVEKSGDVPERLSYAQVQPLFEWALTQLDAQAIAV